MSMDWQTAAVFRAWALAVAAVAVVRSVVVGDVPVVMVVTATVVLLSGVRWLVGRAGG